MSFNIIIRGKNRPEPPRQQRAQNASSFNEAMHRKAGNTTYSMPARQQYAKVSKENKETFRQEKRILELHKKGFNEAAIAGMMFTKTEGKGQERHIKNVIKKNKTIKTDGNI